MRENLAVWYCLNHRVTIFGYWTALLKRPSPQSTRRPFKRAVLGCLCLGGVNLGFRFCKQWQLRIRPLRILPHTLVIPPRGSISSFRPLFDFIEVNTKGLYKAIKGEVSLDLLLICPIHESVVDLTVAPANRSVGIVEDIVLLLFGSKRYGESLV